MTPIKPDSADLQSVPAKTSYLANLTTKKEGKSELFESKLNIIGACTDCKSARSWLLEAAKRKFALCLCDEYLKKPDVEVKKNSRNYTAEEEYFEKNYPKNISFDTILKKRKEIFDPIILLY